MFELVHFFGLFLFIGVIVALYQCSIGYANSVFYPDKVLLKVFRHYEDEIFFYGKNINENGRYKITFLKQNPIKKEDTVHLSYCMDRGKIENIREIYVNNNLVWKKHVMENEYPLNFSEIK